MPVLWTGDYEPMFTKLSAFVIPFAFWIAYVLGLIALTELLIARKSKNRSERRIMRTLAASFIGVGVVIFAALAAGVGEGTTSARCYLRSCWLTTSIVIAISRSSSKRASSSLLLRQSY